MESGIIRKKRKNFSQISNTVLLDNNLSLKAKGLYGLIESLISIPDFKLYKSTLPKYTKEKETAVEAAWKELKEAGYLLQEKIQTPKGFIYEYDLLDEPEKPTPRKPTPGKTQSGKSQMWENGVYNNTQENNIKINNTNNNNTKDNNVFKGYKESFFDKLFDVVVDEEINNKLNIFFKTLKQREIDIVANMDNDVASNFYNKIKEIYDDEEITNKEGYIRSIINGDYKNVQLKQEKKKTNSKRDFHEFKEPNYDNSFNNEVSQDEIDSLLEMRNSEAALKERLQRIVQFATLEQIKGYLKHDSCMKNYILNNPDKVSEEILQAASFC